MISTSPCPPTVELDGFVRHAGVWNARKQVGDQGQPSAPLIVEVHQGPRRVPGVGVALSMAVRASVRSAE